jgi:hypothetical protein
MLFCLRNLTSGGSMKKIILVLTTVLSTAAMAEVSYSMPALEAGFKWNSMDTTGAISSKQSMGIQLGGSTVFNFAPQFGLRTGLFYSERPFKFDTSGSDSSGKITYAEVPVHFMFKFEDYAGIYLGPSLSMKLGDECSGCTLTDIKSMILPITFGAQFKFTPNLGLNLFFESVPSDLAQGLKNSRGIGMNVLLAFD